MSNILFLLYPTTKGRDYSLPAENGGLSLGRLFRQHRFDQILFKQLPKREESSITKPIGPVGPAVDLAVGPKETYFCEKQGSQRDTARQAV